MQKIEHDGKTYVRAEEWADKNRVDDYPQIYDFYPEDIDYLDYLDVRYSEMEENSDIREDVETLREEGSKIADYLADRYEVLFEVDENNHPVGKTDMFFDTEEIKIVDSEEIFDEFMDRLDKVKLNSYDYDFNDKSVYGELNDILETIQEYNAETVEIIDSKVKRDDLFAYAEQLVSEAVLKENGELQDDFVHLAEQYDKDSKSSFSNNPRTIMYQEIRGNASMLQNIQDKYPTPKGFAEHGILVACHSLEEQLKEAFDIEKYDKGTGVIQSDGNRYILAEDFFKDKDSDINKQFRTSPALTFTGKDDEEFKVLVKVDRYNEVFNPVSTYNFLNTQTNEIVAFADLPKEVINDYADKVKPYEIERNVAVADYGKDLDYYKRMIESFIADKVIDRENGGLNPDFLPEDINRVNELFLVDVTAQLVAEARTQNTMLNSWTIKYEINNDERLRENTSLLLDSCAMVAVEKYKDSLVQAFEATKTDVNNLKEVFNNYIDSNIIDNDKDRISETFRDKIGYEDVMLFLESVESVLKEAVTQDEDLKAEVSDFKDGLMEKAIHNAVIEKNDDLQHCFEMENLYKEVDEAVYEDFKEEIENENGEFILD